MVNDLKTIHIGAAIERRRRELGITKNEFAHRIGKQQQYINIIISKDSIKTNLLIDICKALDFNFFTLYCNNASTDKPFIVEEDIEAEEFAKMQDKLQDMTEECDLLRERLQDHKRFVVNLKNQMKDKDYIIELLQKRIDFLTSQLPNKSSE